MILNLHGRSPPQLRWRFLFEASKSMPCKTSERLCSVVVNFDHFNYYIMIRKKPIVIFVVLAGMFFSSCFLAKKSGSSNKDIIIIEAANNQMMHYLNLIPKNKEETFGFENREDFASAEVGRAYQLFTLTPDFFQAEQIGHGDYIMPMNEWLVIVETHGEANALLTVSKTGDKWRTVGVGAAELAKELKHFERLYMSNDHMAEILRIRQLACDVLIVRDANQTHDERVYLLESALSALQEHSESVLYYSLQEVLLMVKEKI